MAGNDNNNNNNTIRRVEYYRYNPFGSPLIDPNPNEDPTQMNSILIDTATDDSFPAGKTRQYDPQTQQYVLRAANQRIPNPDEDPPFHGWLPPDQLRIFGPEGLPTYFSDLTEDHPHVAANHPARGLFFYVNDGPQVPGESDLDYRHRIKCATVRMDIKHRTKPPGPDTAQYPGGFQNPEWKKAEKEYLTNIDRMSREHAQKLSWGTKTFDMFYDNIWNTQKQIRQSINAAKRFNAVREVQEHFRRSGYDELPFPDEVEDSGDDLFDWGEKGPLLKKFRRITKEQRAQGLTQRYSKGVHPDKINRITGSLNPDDTQISMCFPPY